MHVEKLHNDRIILVHGDCLEVLPRIRTKLINMVMGGCTC